MLSDSATRGAGDFKREVGAEFALQNDGVWIDVARAGQVAKRRFGVLTPTDFAGVREYALAVAAIVDGEDVGSGGVQFREIVDGVAQVAVRAVEIKHGIAG